MTMTFFENQILDAISSNCYPGIEPAPTLVSESPKSVAFDRRRDNVEDILYQNLRSDSVFSLIEGLQWKAAVSTIRLSPDEATQWVKKVDNEGLKVKWRRLPIHEACVRKATPEVVFRLLEMFRAGAEAKDDKGRTPLHYAFIHNADMNTIYMLVHAYYDALGDSDFWGKTARDYAMENKSVHHKDIMHMLNESRAEISSMVQDIECKILKQATLLKTSDVSQSIKTQPNPAEVFLEEELAQARIESDVAYVQRDAALSAQDSLHNKVKILEKQLEEKDKMIREMNDLSHRNKALNSLLTKYEKKNKDLEENIETQANKMKEDASTYQKQIDSMKKEFELKSAEQEKQMKGKEKKWKKKQLLYENAQNMMKGVITELSDKLRRMEVCSDDEQRKENMNVPSKKLNISEKKNVGDQMNEIDQLNELVVIYKSQISTLETQVKECKEKISFDELEHTELKKELEIYKSRHDGCKERISSLENLINVYKDASVELEEDLQKAESSFVQVTDQLSYRTAEVDALEEQLFQLTKEIERMKDLKRYNPGPRSDIVTSRDFYRTDIAHLASLRVGSRSPIVPSVRRSRSISPFFRGYA